MSLFLFWDCERVKKAVPIFKNFKLYFLYKKQKLILFQEKKSLKCYPSALQQFGNVIFLG
jgi:hypothetical protein